jgi:hypothetical protein
MRVQAHHDLTDDALHNMGHVCAMMPMASQERKKQHRRGGSKGERHKDKDHG